MILLRDLIVVKTSVHVSTCDANCVEVLTLIRRMFLRLVTEISDSNLEQRISVKFCVNLGKNASDTCAMFSEAYRGEAVEKVKGF